MSDFSRFYLTPNVIFGEREMPGHWIRPRLLSRELEETEVFYYQVTNATAGRPADIAGEVYGNTLLDWLIIAVCGATEVFGWPPAGRLLRLPKRDLVFGELL